jgi:hypothetical protein
MGVGDPSRLLVARRSVQQLIEEQLSFPTFRLRHIVFSNFGLDSEQIKFLSTDLGVSVRVVETSRHSAARSFNVGAAELFNNFGSADYTVKLDDDSRFSTGTLAALVSEADRLDLSLIAPVTLRCKEADRLFDDHVFKRLEDRLPPTLDGGVSYASHVTSDGFLDLAALMIGYSFAEAGAPATPNENGLVFSSQLVTDLMTGSLPLVFSETRGGSEGLRLFAALQGSRHQGRVAVLRRAVFDRDYGDSSQPLSWGRSDAELVISLTEMGVLFPGFSFAGLDEFGKVWRGSVPQGKVAVAKDVDKLIWYAQMLKGSEVDLITSRVPPELMADWQDFVPSFVALADELIKASGLVPKHELGQVSPSCYFNGRREPQLVGGFLHMLGSYIASKEAGREQAVFTTW